MVPESRIVAHNRRDGPAADQHDRPHRPAPGDRRRRGRVPLRRDPPGAGPARRRAWRSSLIVDLRAADHARPSPASSSRPEPWSRSAGPSSSWPWPRRSAPGWAPPCATCSAAASSAGIDSALGRRPRRGPGAPRHVARRRPPRDERHCPSCPGVAQESAAVRWLLEVLPPPGDVIGEVGDDHRRERPAAGLQRPGADPGGADRPARPTPRPPPSRRARSASTVRVEATGLRGVVHGRRRSPSREGYFVTNAHVVAGAERITLRGVAASGRGTVVLVRPRPRRGRRPGDRPAPAGARPRARGSRAGRDRGRARLPERRRG